MHRTFSYHGKAPKTNKSNILSDAVLARSETDFFAMGVVKSFCRTNHLMLILKENFNRERSFFYHPKLKLT